MINQLKTFILLALLTGMVLFIGNLFGTGGLVIAFVFVLLMNGVSYFFSDKIVLWMYGAKEVKDHEHLELQKIVREVSSLANIPMPKLYTIPSPQLNAFATGRSPKHSAVACTEGILTVLTKEELKGVIAHEISHVLNRDILITTVAATLAGVISFVASMAQWAAIFGSDEDSGDWVSLLVLAILTPIIATLLQLALSRSREYLADETGAKLIHHPQALASALIKIEQSVHTTPMKMGNQATSSMFIANPFSAKGFFTLLSTHPPTEERVKKLHQMRF